MSKPIRKVKALVTFDWPEDATLVDIKEYILWAITQYGIGFDKDEPMYGERKNVKVEVLGEPL